MQRFDTVGNILEGFEGITLSLRMNMETFIKKEKKLLSREIRDDKGLGMKKDSKADILTEERKVCYNCREVGHYSGQCPKTKKISGTVESNGASRGPSPGASTAATTTTYLLHSAPIIPPCMLSISFSAVVEEDNECEFKINAMIDSSAGTSIIKESYVLSRSCKLSCKSDFNHRGLNNTKLDVLRVFESDVYIKDKNIRVRFLVVPDNTMSCVALLGRDFIDSIGISLIEIITQALQTQKELTVEKKQLHDINDSNEQLLCMDYLEEDEKSNERLQVDPKADINIAKQINDLFSTEYLMDNESERVEHPYEMKIVLKHDQPISFRPQRLAYSDRDKLRVILDDPESKHIIRLSNSPYASRTVLVRKKTRELRLCIDYRELNRITVKDNFPSLA